MIWIDYFMIFFYDFQVANKYTFQMPKVKDFVEEWSTGKCLNLFAGKTRLNLDEIRVDLSNEFSPDFNMEAFDFVQYAISNDMKFDTIILDPPYSLRKSMEKYNGKVCSSFTKIVNEIPNILNSNGRVITLGYNTSIMGKNRGFVKIALGVFTHGGAINDTLCIVEELF